MKKSIIILVAFFCYNNLCTAQMKKITGKVYIDSLGFWKKEEVVNLNADSGLNSIQKRLPGVESVIMMSTKLIPANDYKIYLLKENVRGSVGKLKLNAPDSFFEITLTKKELRKYHFLEFKKGIYNSIINIDKIGDDTLIVKFERIVRIVKPAIYLYPIHQQEITVIHKFKGKIENTYPLYNDKWQVIAEPNGSLFNKADNRKYNYLFWDGIFSFPENHYNYKDGYYISREETTKFLQRKLEHIGLNETEINDFIVYWLPLLSKNEMNFIHFSINDNIDNSSFLEVTPKPESQLRLFMEFRKSEKNHLDQLPEQVLPVIKRNGFTLVEWGGAEIGSGIIE